MQKNNNRVCLGAFAGAHGVKGEAKVKTFTESPENIAAYGAVETEGGARTFTFKVVKVLKDDIVLVRAPEIASREDAESLKGVRLYVERAALPSPEEDEFYLDDLVGLKACDENGAPMGVIKAVFNFGAGDLLELADIPDVKGVRLVSFTRENAPNIDFDQNAITIRRQSIELADNDDAQPDAPGR
jgi:16S rRNA processing protein RimM